MNTIRILSLALLAGVGVAGAVWYIWGIVENLAAFKKQRASADQSEFGSDSKNEDADSV